MGEHIFLRRQDALRQKLSEQNLDGILSSNLTNIRYLCGFTGSAASCLIIPDEAYFISDDRYEIQSKQQVKGLKRFIDFGSHLKIIKDNNLIPNGLKVAFEGDHISVNSYKKLSESFPNVHWESTSYPYGSENYRCYLYRNPSHASCWRYREGDRQSFSPQI